EAEPEPGSESAEEAGPAEAGSAAATQPAAATLAGAGPAEDPAAARRGALPAAGRDAQGARHAAPRRAAAEREGGAEEAAPGAPRRAPRGEGLVRRPRLRARRLATLLAAALALAAVPRAHAQGTVRSEVDS